MVVGCTGSSCLDMQPHENSLPLRIARVINAANARKSVAAARAGIRGECEKRVQHASTTSATPRPRAWLVREVGSPKFRIASAVWPGQRIFVEPASASTKTTASLAVAVTPLEWSSAAVESVPSIDQHFPHTRRATAGTRQQQLRQHSEH